MPSVAASENLSSAYPTASASSWKGTSAPEDAESPVCTLQHRIVSSAERRGQARVAEMNRQVLTNLDRVIASLEAEASQEDGPADAG